MRLLWFNFRRLTSEEWKWCEFLEGKEKMIEDSKFAYEYRKAVRRVKKEEYLNHIAGIKKEIEKINLDISKALTDIENKYSDVVQKHSFPLRGLLNMVFPRFIQEATYEIIKS